MNKVIVTQKGYVLSLNSEHENMFRVEAGLEGDYYLVYNPDREDEKYIATVNGENARDEIMSSLAEFLADEDMNVFYTSDVREEEDYATPPLEKYEYDGL